MTMLNMKFTDRSMITPYVTFWGKHNFNIRTRMIFKCVRNQQKLVINILRHKRTLSAHWNSLHTSFVSSDFNETYYDVFTEKYQKVKVIDPPVEAPVAVDHNHQV